MMNHSVPTLNGRQRLIIDAGEYEHPVYKNPNIRLAEYIPLEKPGVALKCLTVFVEVEGVSGIQINGDPTWLLGTHRSNSVVMTYYFKDNEYITSAYLITRGEKLRTVRQGPFILVSHVHHLLQADRLTTEHSSKPLSTAFYTTESMLHYGFQTAVCQTFKSRRDIGSQGSLQILLAPLAH
jgi:hypothetical protein